MPIVDLQAAPDVTVSERAVLCPLFFQECQQASDQYPETQNGLYGHDLMVSAATQVLLVLKEGLHLPTDRGRVYQSLLGVFKLGTSPVWKGWVQRFHIMTGDELQRGLTLLYGQVNLALRRHAFRLFRNHNFPPGCYLPPPPGAVR